MFNHVVISGGVVVATIQSDRRIKEEGYALYEELNTDVPFSEIAGCPVSDGVVMQPPAEPEPTKEEIEIEWRNMELDYVDSKNYASDFPYMDEIKQYKQELRDYPDKEGFPECDRPARPLTPKGNPIIS